MKKTRPLVGAAAAALALLPIVGTFPAFADPSITAPTADGDGNTAVWYAGDTQTITWDADSKTDTNGVLELWKGTVKVATIATGIDVSKGSYVWTIPTTLPKLLAEGLSVHLKGGLTGTTYDVTAAVNLRSPSVTHVGASLIPLADDGTLATPDADNTATDITAAVVAGKYLVRWKASTTAGDTVKIDVVRTVGKTVTTTPALISNDGGVNWVNATAVDDTSASLIAAGSTDASADYHAAIVQIPEKLAATDALTATTGTFKFVVTPSTKGGVAGSNTTAFKVFPKAISLGVLTSADETGKVGAPYVIKWTNVGEVGDVKIEATPISGKKVVVTTSTTGVAEVDGDGKPTGVIDYTWYPTAIGTYSIAITSNKTKTATVTSTKKVAVAAADPWTLKENAASVTTPEIGTVTALSWEYDDSSAAPQDINLPVDITLVNDVDTKVAAIASGVLGTMGKDGSGVATGVLTYNYTVPLTVAPGSYQVKIVAADGSVQRTPLTVTWPTTGVAVTAPTGTPSQAQGSKFDVTWTIGTATQAPVNIDLVDSTGKTTSLAKAVTGNPAVLATKTTSAHAATPGTYTVTLPLTVAEGSYSVKVSTAAKYNTVERLTADSKAKPDTLSATAAITVAVASFDATAPVALTNGTGDHAATFGQKVTLAWKLSNNSLAPVTLDLYKGTVIAKSAKPVSTIKTSGTTTVNGDGVGAGSVDWTPDFKMVPANASRDGSNVWAGDDYIVRATIVGTKITQDFALHLNEPTLAVTEFTGSPATFNQGQAVKVQWTVGTGVADDVSVSLQKGTGKAVKLDKGLTKNGAGAYVWYIPATLTPGSDYKLVITDNTDKFVTDSSDAAFTVLANSTTLAK